MKKKILMILLALVLCLTSLGAAPLRLSRLKVINKSGRKIEISLTGKYQEKFYYLHIPEGTRLTPAEQDFTLVPDTYSSSVYYVELWDPVYGNQCNSKGQSLDINHNVVLIVLACDLTPANAGETAALVKLGGKSAKKGR